MSDNLELLAKIDAVDPTVIDLRFTDLEGRWRQLHLAVERFKQQLRDPSGAIMINGSAIPGWREATDNDLELRPVGQNPFTDPYAAQTSLVVLAEAAEPGTKMDYERDPRSVVRRALQHMTAANIADQTMVGLEFGFHIMERAAFNVGPSAVTAEFSDRELDPGNRTGPLGVIPLSGGDQPAPMMAIQPNDPSAAIREEIAGHLALIGLERPSHLHGAAPALHEMSMPALDMLNACDGFQIARYVTQQVAASFGRTATFLAKPLADNSTKPHPGAGLSIQLSLFSGTNPIFSGSDYADLSTDCLHFIGGILKHGCALNALTNPTTNSYRRLRPSLEAPTHLAYAAHNRTAAVRIPYAQRAGDKRIEIRFPDPSANPYLALPAILMAGLDGIAKKIHPGDAVDRNLYDLKPERTQDLKPLARSLDSALDALELDHEFLLEGDVFSDDLLQSLIAIKRDEIERIQSTPHPAELAMTW